MTGFSFLPDCVCVCVRVCRIWTVVIVVDDVVVVFMCSIFTISYAYIWLWCGACGPPPPPPKKRTHSEERSRKNNNNFPFILFCRRIVVEFSSLFHISSRCLLFVHRKSTTTAILLSCAEMNSYLYLSCRTYLWCVSNLLAERSQHAARRKWNVRKGIKQATRSRRRTTTAAVATISKRRRERTKNVLFVDYAPEKRFLLFIFLLRQYFLLVALFVCCRSVLFFLCTRTHIRAPSDSFQQRFECCRLSSSMLLLNLRCQCVCFQFVFSSSPIRFAFVISYFSLDPFVGDVVSMRVYCRCRWNCVEFIDEIK